MSRSFEPTKCEQGGCVCREVRGASRGPTPIAGGLRPARAIIPDPSAGTDPSGAPGEAARPMFRARRLDGKARRACGARLAPPDSPSARWPGRIVELVNAMRRFLLSTALLAAAGLLVMLAPRTALADDDRPVQFHYDEPAYSVRIYEVFQWGPELRMEARTNKGIGPDLIRDLDVGEIWPPEDEPPLRIGRRRNHVDYFASYWRDDLSTKDRGRFEVEVWEVEESAAPGVAHVRVRLVERPDTTGRSYSSIVGNRGTSAGATGIIGDEARHGARLYEVYQKGPKLKLQERTTRHFGPDHVRGVRLGEVWPPADEPPLIVWKSRDHLAFLGSYWQQHGMTDYGANEVIVWEAAEPEAPGTAQVRMRIVPRAEREEGAMHHFLSPERADRKRGAMGGDGA